MRFDGVVEIGSVDGGTSVSGRKGEGERYLRLFAVLFRCRMVKVCFFSHPALRKGMFTLKRRLSFNPPRS